MLSSLYLPHQYFSLSPSLNSQSILSSPCLNQSPLFVFFCFFSSFSSFNSSCFHFLLFTFLSFTPIQPHSIYIAFIISFPPPNSLLPLLLLLLHLLLPFLILPILFLYSPYSFSFYSYCLLPSRLPFLFILTASYRSRRS